MPQPTTSQCKPISIVILISGNGSNLQAIIDACQQGLPVHIAAVISNRPEAHGLQRAQAAGVPTDSLNHQEFASREAFDQALQQRIDAYQPELVVLAGFMRLLSNAFVNHYLGHLINIHPSLLPDFKGLNTHQRAVDAFQHGEITEHGASVHFVTPELDGGPVALQAAVDINPGDTVSQLAERVLKAEHKLYPLALRWYAEGRLQMHNGQAWLDGQALDRPVRVSADQLNH